MTSLFLQFGINNRSISGKMSLTGMKKKEKERKEKERKKKKRDRDNYRRRDQFIFHKFETGVMKEDELSYLQPDSGSSK